MSRQIAERFAKQAMSPEGERLFRLFCLEDEQANSSQRLSLSDENALQERIGIWKRKKGDRRNLWSRDDAQFHQWHLWAQLPTISPKGEKKRVVLLGESLARGYLFDPEFTPARLLEHYLGQETNEGVEVIDLAKTSIELSELLELVKSASLLEPDAIVIMAGNNWFPGKDVVLQSDAGKRQELASLLEQGGFQEYRAHIECLLESQIEGAIESITDYYKNIECALLWVIPESNLEDWEDSDYGPAWSSESCQKEWYTCRKAIQRSWESGDIEKTLALAANLRTLDQGLSNISYRYESKCYKKQLDAPSRLAALVRARESVIWDPIFVSPRPFSVSEKTLKRTLSERGVCFVELSELFRQHEAEAIPSTLFFIDYCHLNVDGMQLAMAETATILLKWISSREVSLKQLMADAIRPSEQIESEAHFLAAIHNSRWGQSYDVVKRHCSKAIACHQQTALVMQAFAELQCHAHPYWTHDGIHKMSKISQQSLKHFFSHFYHSYLDHTLFEVIIDTLEEHGVRCRDSLNAVRLKKYSASRNPIELTERFYIHSYGEREALREFPSLPNSLKRFDYWKAFDIHSKFYFVSEYGKDLELKITYRMPQLTDPGDAEISPSELEIQVNQKGTLRMPASRTWRTASVKISGLWLSEGHNEVTLDWPCFTQRYEDGVSQSVDALERGVWPVYYPVWGEIDSLVLGPFDEDQKQISLV